MAIDISLDQIRIAQIIANVTSPGKLAILSNKTEGADQYNGTITDAGFISDYASEDAYFVISGSKFNARTPNQIGVNSGIVLFTGDVVMSGNLIVGTDQSTFYTPINAKSSSFIGNQDIRFRTANGSLITNSFYASNKNLNIYNENNLSAVLGTQDCVVNGVNFGGMLWAGSSGIQATTASSMINGNNNSIVSSLFGISINDSFLDLNTISYTLLANNSSLFGTSISRSVLLSNVDSTFDGLSTVFAASTKDTNITAGGDSSYNSLIVLGINAGTFFNTYGSAYISNNNVVAENALQSGLLGCSYVQISGNFYGGLISRSFAMFATGSSGNPLSIVESNKLIFGTVDHTSWFSGSVHANSVTTSYFVSTNIYASNITASNITASNAIYASSITASNITASNAIYSSKVIGTELSGSHQFLNNGTTRAFSTFTTNSSPTHVNTASSGQIQFGAMTRIGMGNYVSSTATSSIPEIAGTAYINQYEHEDVMNISGAYAKFRCILSTVTNSTTAVVKLYNVTDGGYVQIGGVGVYQLSTTSSIPTALVSSNLTDATLGLSMSNKVYETHIYISGAGSPAIVNHHKSELLFAPRTLSGYS